MREGNSIHKKTNINVAVMYPPTNSIQLQFTNTYEMTSQTAAMDNIHLLKSEFFPYTGIDTPSWWEDHGYVYHKPTGFSSHEK